MENHGHRRFVLTGSSARKLKRGASNLLAGRAMMRRLAPLTAKETSFSLPPRQCMHYGLLPYCADLASDEQREDFLRSYVQTYLTEEVRNEGIVRNMGPFTRFCDVAALAAGSAVNVSGLARDAAVARDTVRGYFSVLEDTLLGRWLPAYRPRAKVKEVARPKFYWFDSGVLNAAAGAFDQPMPSDWQGILIEHWLVHEISSYLDYSRSRGTLGYWGTPSHSEVDFVWWYGDRVVAIEVKASTEFRSRQLKGIRALGEQRPLEASYVVYQGDRELKVDETWVLPVGAFLRRLHQGDIVGAR
jgi:predicted AAA+ superfamily ATPase